MAIFQTSSLTLLKIINLLQIKKTTIVSKNSHYRKSLSLMTLKRSFMELGKGGFSKVYAQKSSSQEGQTVIKKILIEKKSLFPLLLNQISIISLCEHENIVKFHSCYFDDPQTFCIQMEMVKGCDLTKCKAGLNYETITKLLFEVCKGLHYLHERGIIHRDIKPSNIMVGENGQIKIIDFGISEFMIKTSGKRLALSGTPNYMAPEVSLKRDYNEKSDIYSLGVLVYELVYQTNPHSILDKTKKPMTGKSCPDDLIALIERMLEKCPKRRISAIEILNHPMFIDRKMEISKNQASDISLGFEQKLRA